MLHASSALTSRQAGLKSIISIPLSRQGMTAVRSTSSKLFFEGKAALLRHQQHVKATIRPSNLRKTTTRPVSPSENNQIKSRIIITNHYCSQVHDWKSRMAYGTRIEDPRTNIEGSTKALRQIITDFDFNFDLAPLRLTQFFPPNDYITFRTVQIFTLAAASTK